MRCPVAKFRKKPVVVEAVRWRDSSDSYDLAQFVGTMASIGTEVYIHTPEGDMRVSPGDWVIKGVMGEFYPCKPDVFAATYEPVGD